MTMELQRVKAPPIGISSIGVTAPRDMDYETLSATQVQLQNYLGCTANVELTETASNTDDEPTEHMLVTFPEGASFGDKQRALRIVHMAFEGLE